VLLNPLTALTPLNEFVRIKISLAVSPWGCKIQPMVPSSELSRSQVDRLGERLRKGIITDNDLQLLDRFRRSFRDSYEKVVRLIRDEMGLEPAGRPQKTPISIIEKLRRQSIRLSQIQDISGCRIVVLDLLAQDEVVERLQKLFDQLQIDDRRTHPSHGYRAVHVIIQESGKLVEVQVRTSLQHLWAEVSEKLSDLEPSIKYGHGDPSMLLVLDVMSKNITAQELAEAAHETIMSSDDNEDPDEMLREGPRVVEILQRRIAIVNMLEAVHNVFLRIKGLKE
jgi:putative GTP pyrophosphokinase